MLDCKRKTANALPSLCIIGVEFIPIKLLVLLDRNSKEERTSMYRYFAVLSASFCCINVNFDWNECFYRWGVWRIHFVKGNYILVAHENSTLKHFEIHSFCALYSVTECSIGDKTCIGLCIDACLSCYWKQLHLCVDYFVMGNRADYHGNKWRWSDFRFTFVHMLRNRGRQCRVFFSLFSKINSKPCHSQEDKLSNIIWRDHSNVQARLIIGCSHLWQVPTSHELV